MPCADHLWEIDNDRLTVFSSDKNIELVEITVDQSVFGQADDKLHKGRVEIRW